jgi:hypothetical protein
MFLVNLAPSCSNRRHSSIVAAAFCLFGANTQETFAKRLPQIRGYAFYSERLAVCCFLVIALLRCSTYRKIDMDSTIEDWLDIPVSE